MAEQVERYANRQDNGPIHANSGDRKKREDQNNVSCNAANHWTWQPGSLVICKKESSPTSLRVRDRYRRRMPDEQPSENWRKTN